MMAFLLQKKFVSFDDYVIGQKTAKEILSVAVHNHYKRLIMKLKIIKMLNYLNQIFY